MEIEIFPHDPKNPGFGYKVRYRDSGGNYTDWDNISEPEAQAMIGHVVTMAKNAPAFDPRTI